MTMYVSFVLRQHDHLLDTNIRGYFQIRSFIFNCSEVNIAGIGVLSGGGSGRVPVRPSYHFFTGTFRIVTMIFFIFYILHMEFGRK